MENGKVIANNVQALPAATVSWTLTDGTRWGREGDAAEDEDKHAEDDDDDDDYDADSLAEYLKQMFSNQITEYNWRLKVLIN